MRACLAVVAAAVAVLSITRIAVAADVNPAVSDLELRAEAGDAEAQNRLGTMLLVGVGVAKNPAQAEAWLRKAATQKFPPALFQLGTLHRRGEDGVGRDFAAASRELLAAADLGDVNAKLALGLLCKADEPDAGAAMRRRYDDASKGDAAALVDVGAVFESGVCTDRDASFASWWYEQAAAKGFVPAMERLAFLDRGQGASPDAAATADAWLLRAAESGGARANFELGRRELAAGQLAAGFSYMVKASQQGSQDASELLCARGADERLAPAKYGDALGGDAKARIGVAEGLLGGRCQGMKTEWRRWWLELGADAGSVDAQLAVAGLVLGDDVRPDVYRYDAAMLRLRQAAEAGSPDAAFAMGVMCRNDAALAWLRSAAEAGIVEAELELGLRLRGTDVVQSMMWLNIAAARGSVEARNELGKVEAAAGPTLVAEAQRIAKTIAGVVSPTRALDRRADLAAKGLCAAKVPRLPLQVQERLIAYGFGQSNHLRIDGVQIEHWTELDYWVSLLHSGDTVQLDRSTIQLEGVTYDAPAICSGRQVMPRATPAATRGRDACAGIDISVTEKAWGTTIVNIDAGSPFSHANVSLGDVVTDIRAYGQPYEIRSVPQHLAVVAQVNGLRAPQIGEVRYFLRSGKSVTVTCGAR